MLKENEKKTKLEPEKPRGRGERLSLLAALLIIFFGLILAIIFVLDKSEHLNSAQPPVCAGIMLEKGCYELERAKTDEQRIRGLSGRESLAGNSGMLFVFDASEKKCFWMKDMKFSIDILWLNESKEVLKIEKNVSPASYPQSFCSEQTNYVLEFNSGTTEQNGLKVGSRLQF